MNICLADFANIGTIVIAVFAVIGAIFAVNSLRVAGRKYRYDILISLINQIADQKERENRAKIYSKFRKNTTEKEVESWVEAGRKARNSYLDCMDLSVVSIENEKETSRVIGKKESLDTIYAIEETIACFDKVGFFLLCGDKNLRKEAPDWIWTMTEGMWARLGKYIIHRQETEDKNWGKYFRKLALEAKGYINKNYHD